MAYERELDAFELVWVASQETNAYNNFAMCARIQGEVNDEELRQAVRSVIKHNPVLQVSLDRDTVSFLRIPMDNLQLPIQTLQGTYKLEEILAKENEEAIVAKVHQPLFRLTWIEGAESTHDLVLAIHHAIGDGTTCLLFLKQLLAVLSGESLQDNTDAALHPGSLHFFKDAPRLCGCGPSSWWGLLTQDAGKSQYWLLPESAAKSGSVLSDRKNRHTFSQIDAQTMAKLLDMARARRTTIHGALVAATAFALADAAAMHGSKPKGGAFKFLQETPINLRTHCGIPEDLMGAFVASYHGPVSLNPSTRFWDLAISSKQGLEIAMQKRAPMAQIGALRKLQGGRNAVQCLDMQKKYLLPMVAGIKFDKHGNEMPDPKHGRDLALGITNLGRSGLQSRYGSGKKELVLNSFHWAGDNRLGATLYLRVLSVSDGRLMVTVTHAEPAVQQDFAGAFVSAFEKALAVAATQEELSFATLQSSC
eukprot:TRINITY_DN109206_c0_g1_i1.p1 TRINITY_DN109206_c0_g1~~TRINITY_DN109206_c0_g1_i1.p1  ORF type:complete len:478 (+),score=97.80 TRINITY_DN109206_c0_g1_i1:71-1504(+)